MSYGLAGIASNYYSNMYQQNKVAGKNNIGNFNEVLAAKGATGTNAVDATRTDEYLQYLKQKYGNVSIQSIGKDQASLDRVGKSMSGSDVIIAPNIFEQMANDIEKAAYYEQKIDYYFDTVIPRGMAMCAAQGLVFQPAGVVVHEDGTVTYITGCGDSPERVAEVNAINKAKQEKRAEQRKEQLERSQEATERQQAIIDEQIQNSNNEKQIFAQARNRQLLTSDTDAVTNTSGYVVSAVSAYENALNAISKTVTETEFGSV